MGSIISECLKEGNSETSENSVDCLISTKETSSTLPQHSSVSFEISPVEFDHYTQGTQVRLMLTLSENNIICGSFKDFIELCIHNEDFCDLLTDTINDLKLDAFFWECAPVSYSTLSHPFEFVILPAPALSQRTANAKDFEAKIRKLNTVVTFPNLGKDATLIVPTTPSTFDEYWYMAHMSLFLQHAGEARTRQLWRCAAATLLRHLQLTKPDKPLWMSTNGLGVSWLHIRLDKAPKYYMWQPYKYHATITSTSDTVKTEPNFIYRDEITSAVRSRDTEEVRCDRKTIKVSTMKRWRRLISRLLSPPLPHVRPEEEDKTIVSHSK